MYAQQSLQKAIRRNSDSNGLIGTVSELSVAAERLAPWLTPRTFIRKFSSFSYSSAHTGTFDTTLSWSGGAVDWCID